MGGTRDDIQKTPPLDSKNNNMFTDADNRQLCCIQLAFEYAAQQSIMRFNKSLLLHHRRLMWLCLIGLL